MPPDDAIETLDEAAPAEPEDEPAVDAGPICLGYVGQGRYIIGVPTKDLCNVPADEADRLTETGLYVRVACPIGDEAQPGD